MLLTDGFPSFDCIENPVPACAGSSRPVGLGAVTAAGWALAAVGAAAVLGAIALRFRVRRFASAVPVLALASITFVVARMRYAAL